MQLFVENAVNNLDMGGDPNIAYNIVSDTIINVINVHVPLKTAKIKPKPKQVGKP